MYNLFVESCQHTEKLLSGAGTSTGPSTSATSLPLGLPNDSGVEFSPFTLSPSFASLIASDQQQKQSGRVAGKKDGKPGQESRKSGPGVETAATAATPTTSRDAGLVAEKGSGNKEKVKPPLRSVPSHPSAPYPYPSNRIPMVIDLERWNRKWQRAATMRNFRPPAPARAMPRRVSLREESSPRK